MFVLSIGIIGAWGFHTTDYQIGTTEQNKDTVWAKRNGVRTIVLFTANFSPLSSLLNTGYYLHTRAIPILRNAKTPEHSTRNLFIGYTLVWLSYIIIGALGYVGFIGVMFKDYFKEIRHTSHAGEINQNCLNMIGYIEPVVFMVKFAIFMLLFSTYPLLNLFMRTHLLNLFY